MTTLLFRDDPYLRQATAQVVSAVPGAIVLDRTIFYPQSGGQPGDCGTLRCNGTEIPIVTTVKGDGETVIHVPADSAPLPAPGAQTDMLLDWDRRHRLMRMHTSLHLLCSLIPGAGVTGGQIGADKSRLDFDLPSPPTKEALTEKLNALIAQDHAVSQSWITDTELDANPGIVRTLSVQPPRGAGRIRLVTIGDDTAPIDRQPCGGTHVARTGEIGRVEITKIENKGKSNRRVVVTLIA